MSSSLSPELQRVIAYYDNETGGYWVDRPDGWAKLNVSELGRRLRDAGHPTTNVPGLYVSLLDREVLRIQNENRVDYAGALAGYLKGIHEIYGQKLLVTSSPKLLKPTKGDWPIWEACLESLYKREHPDQIAVSHCWHKMAVEGLYRRDFKPGHAKIVFGPNDSGKSFEQMHATTPSLGGRTADPWRYLSGKTDFNADLMRNEHLCSMDPDVNSIRDRLDLGNRIKQFTVNELHSYHCKNRDAFPVRPFLRLTISANDQPSNLAMVSMFDKSVLEKVIFLKSSPQAIPPPKYAHMEYHAFCRAVEAEMPHFVWFLLNQFKIPAGWESRRFGFKAFHHPDILDTICEQASEMQMLALLEDKQFFVGLRPSYTVAEIAEFLQVLDSGEAQKLARNLKHITHNLDRLNERFPDKIFRLPRNKTRRGWRILPCRETD